MASLTKVPLRHQLMMLVGGHLHHAGAMRAAFHQLNVMKWQHMAAVHSTASFGSRPASSSGTPAGQTGAGSAWHGGPTDGSSTSIPNGGHDWSHSASSSSWGGRPRGCRNYGYWMRWADPSTWIRHSRGAADGWANAGRYGGRSGSHHRTDWTPEEAEKWEKFQKQIWSKAAEWSTWAARWTDEVAAATQRTAAECAAASRTRPAAASSYSAGATRTLSLLMREQPSQYLVEVATPGVARENIKITITDGELVVATRSPVASASAASSANVEATDSKTKATAAAAGARDSDAEVDENVGSIELPSDAVASSIKAHYNNGLLTMSLPKHVAPSVDIPIN